jgi:hypothetical protein
MLAERAPFVGIVLALLFVAVETVGLIVYAPVPEASTAASVAKPDPTHGYKRIKVRCRR